MVVRRIKYVNKYVKLLDQSLALRKIQAALTIIFPLEWKFYEEGELIFSSLFFLTQISYFFFGVKRLFPIYRIFSELKNSLSVSFSMLHSDLAAAIRQKAEDPFVLAFRVETLAAYSNCFRSLIQIHFYSFLNFSTFLTA